MISHRTKRSVLISAQRRRRRTMRTSGGRRNPPEPTPTRSLSYDRAEPPPSTSHHSTQRQGIVPYSTSLWKKSGKHQNYLMTIPNILATPFYILPFSLSPVTTPVDIIQVFSCVQRPCNSDAIDAGGGGGSQAR